MENDVKLSIKDVQKMYGVTLMTVNNWRKGSKKKEPLPSHSEPRGITGRKDGVYFLKSVVRAWAKKHNIKEVK